MDSKRFALALLIVAAAVLPGCNGPATPQAVERVVTQVVEREKTVQVIERQVVERPVEVQVVATATPVPKSGGKVVLRRSGMQVGDITNLDPGLDYDVPSAQWINMTNVGLMYLNQEDASIHPGLAERWEVSPDGKTYTFHLRKDIPWVRWDDARQQVVKVQTCPDKDGKTQDRIVTAQDFAYGILRALDPKTASPSAYLLNLILDGAEAYNGGNVTDANSVGVRAIDPQTLEVKFLQPAAFNATIIGLYTAHAVPRWLIDGDECTQARGERWTETGFFQGNGPFTLKEWFHTASATFVKNPFWPGTLDIPQARIDEINDRFLALPAAFAEYEIGNLDATVPPSSELDRIKSDPTLSKQLHTALGLCTSYYGFNTKAPVVADVRVRQALSLAVDRQALIENVLKGNQAPARWFCSPGLVACPTPKDYPDLGVKYDPAKAKSLLDAYLKEKNTTADQLDVTLMFPILGESKPIAEAVQNMWKQNLGLDVKLVNLEWKAFLPKIKDPKDTPQMFAIGWCADYPDANNFDKEVAAFGGAQNPARGGGFNWQNQKFEDLVARAALEMDPQKRIDLYAQAEQILSWEDPAMIPLYWMASVEMTKPYVTRTYSVAGPQEFNKWDVDMSQVK